jgi:hypothetical protein
MNPIAYCIGNDKYYLYNLYNLSNLYHNNILNKYNYLFKTNNYKECSICLQNNKDNYFMDFYKYNNSKYQHSCICKPHIHLSCFKKLLNKYSKCIICGKSITIANNNYLSYNKIQYILTTYTFFSFSLLITYTTFQIFKLFKI